MSLKPIITVCSDASMSTKLKIATWACYIRTPDLTIKLGGVFKEYSSGSYWAETRGIANALSILNSQVKNLEKYKIILYCDNNVALIEPRIKNTPASKHHKASLEKRKFYDDHIKSILLKAREYETRHVKGHLPEHKWDTGSKRNFMNNWCDEEAKRYMAIAKKEAESATNNN